MSPQALDNARRGRLAIWAVCSPVAQSGLASTSKGGVGRVHDDDAMVNWVFVLGWMGAEMWMRGGGVGGGL